MPTMTQSDWLKVEAPATAESPVDRDAGVIRGVELAAAGKFKDGRGYFSTRSLEAGIKLAVKYEKGLKSRMQHPNMTDDGLAKFLGRFNNHRLSEDGTRWLADLKFDASAYSSPAGDLATYVMDRAESDEQSFGTSLVGKFNWFNSEGEQLNRAQMEKAWEVAPGTVHWVPIQLHASDVVDEGNATNSFLSVSDLPDRYVREASEALDTLFAEQPRSVVEERCLGFLNRYLDHRYGVSTMSSDNKTPAPENTPDRQQQAPEVVQTFETSKPADVQSEVLATSATPGATSATPGATAANAVPLTPQPAATAPVDQARLQADRACEIVQLCNLARSPEKAAALIARLELSAADVRELLSQRLAADGVLNDMVPPARTDAEPVVKTPEELGRQEYRQNREVLEAMGVSEEDYLYTLEINRRGGVVREQKSTIANYTPEPAA